MEDTNKKLEDFVEEKVEVVEAKVEEVKEVLENPEGLDEVKEDVEAKFEDLKEDAKEKFEEVETKFEHVKNIDLIPVTSGQMSYEKAHLMKKLEIRDPEKYKELRPIVDFKPHPLFYIIDGKIEEWEMV